LDRPRVSVVIPVFNQERYLAEAVQSALEQTLQPTEVIVVDDGSTDRSPSIARGFAERIRYVRQTNVGVAAARNRGALLAEGEFVAFLDSDDAWLPEKVVRQVALCESDPGLGLVHCGVEEVDEKGRRVGFRLNGREGWIARDMLFFRSTVLGGGSGALIPRRVLSEVGGFDERLSTSADWDLYHRIASRYRVGFVREPLLRYRRHPSNMHANVRAMERDMLLAYSKALADSPEGTLRRGAYGALRRVLAASYLGQRLYADGLRNLGWAAWLDPLGLGLAMAGGIGRRLGEQLKTGHWY
jgi:glycosyltransferase involved in cell wall biosynthesis